MGKVSPKGETELSPEERLLKAIFGDKAGDVKDTALKVPPGVEGIVIDVKVFSRLMEDPLIRDQKAAATEKERNPSSRRSPKSGNSLRDRSPTSCEGQKVVCLYNSETQQQQIEPGRKIAAKELSDTLDFHKLELTSITVDDNHVTEQIKEMVAKAEERSARCASTPSANWTRSRPRTSCPPGVVQLVKVYIAEKRKVSVGDKMAGRHGNKGIVAKIVPAEDMPFLPDGTPVEIVLNPLGVPSRMNVGQILETHLGYAARMLGLAVETPVFHGASERGNLRPDGPAPGCRSAARARCAMGARASRSTTR